MRRLGVVAAVLVAVLSAGCVRGSAPDPAEEARERFVWVQVCREFGAEVTSKLGGRPLTDPEQFKDVFLRMAADQAAPKDFREAMEEMWESRPSSKDADAEQFATELEKLRNKCRDVGFSIA